MGQRIDSLQFARHQLPHAALLIGDAAGRVDDLQAELVDEVVVLLEHLALEQAEALVHVGAPAHVHAGLVELQLHPPREQPVERDLDRHPEVERDVGLHREAVQVAHPLPVHAARDVPRERRVGVPVGQHDHPGLERRDDLVEQAVGEVGRVQQAERRRRQQVLLLAGLGRRLDQRGRVPLSDDDRPAGRRQPLGEQAELRGLARAVDALDDDQASRGTGEAWSVCSAWIQVRGFEARRSCRGASRAAPPAGAAAHRSSSAGPCARSTRR